MKSSKRLTILIILCALFIITAPLTILLTLGYRYDAATGRLFSTGTLMIASAPKGTTILLNGKKTKQLTPAILRYLVPGEYDVQLTKDSYQPWNKHFSILPNRVTVARPANEPITLFLSRPIITALATTTRDVIPLGNNFITVTATSTLTFEDPATKTLIPTPIPATPLPNNSTPSNGEWIISTAYQHIYATSLRSRQTLDLTAIVPGVAEVQPLNTDTVLLRTADKKLFQYSVANRLLRLRKTDVAAFSAFGQDIYFLGSSGLLASNTASTTLQTISPLPRSFVNARLIAAPQGRIFAMLDRELFYITTRFERLASDVSAARWDEQAGKLLFSNDNMIGVFDPTSGHPPEIIIRSTSKISNPIINSPANALFYLENNTLKAIELDATVPRVITDILTFETPPTKLFLDNEGKIVHYLIPGQGLFKAQIR